MRVLLAILSLVPLVAPGLLAADRAAPPVVYVNNLTGADDRDGLAPAPGEGPRGPLKSIMAAVKKAPVGALIDIAHTGTDYRESVQIQGYRLGRPAAPLILEGHGAAVTGLVALAPERWQPLRDDIYWFENQLPDGKFGPMPNSNWLMHWKHQGWFTERQAPEIFFVDGQPAPHTRDLETIPVGGFFYDTQASPRRLYFRLPAGKQIGQVRVEIPLNTGVYVSDDYVVVRNLASRYSQDDGFAGFWGVGVVFENIDGSFNCDQGFSMHGTSVTMIDGGLFERNGGAGIVDVMSCLSSFRNVVVRDNMVGGAILMGVAHSFLGCRFWGNYSVQVQGTGGTAVSLSQCLVDGTGADTPNNTAVQLDIGRLDHCTVLNGDTGLQADLAVSVSNSLIANCTRALIWVRPLAQARFSLRKTILGPGAVVWGDKTIGEEQWAAFAGETKQVADVYREAVQLQGPLFLLPKDSPNYKGADYGMVPGADRLQPWEGWAVLP